MEAFDPHGTGQNKLLNGVLVSIVESIYVHRSYLEDCGHSRYDLIKSDNRVSKRP
jgi:hypothetical protein